MTQHDELAKRKARARRDAEARRATAASATAAAVALRHLSAVLAGNGAKVLAGYMAMRSEIDPLPAMAAHAGPVCVPVIDGRGRPLRFRAWSPGAEMVPGPFGARVPASGAWLEPEVLIVPLLAFDRRGYRLGYGGGFYDRTLQALRAAGPRLAIGFAFAAQELGEVPSGANDQPLDLIVTEAGVIAPH
jgi:5-formyltetrahydrofolate cyclo-ligase